MKNMIPEYYSYDYLINRKWFPSCGEVHLDPIPQGSEVQVITRGTIITDDQGAIVSNSPGETQALCNTLNHIWETIVVPEMKKRKESGLTIPFPLNSITILFDPKSKNKIFKYNEDCRLKGQMKLRPNISIKAGQNIYFEHICEINKVVPPTIDNRPAAFIICEFRGKQISLYFDFRPNDSNFCEDDWKNEEIWLANAYLETQLASIFGHLSILIPQLRHYDIPFTIGPSSKKIKKVFEIVNEAKNIDDLNKKLSAVLTIKEAGSLVDNWLQFEAFQKRKELLVEAFKSFKYGIHSGAITVLMSQIEGIITEELIKEQKGIDQKGKSKHWTTQIDEFYNIVISENIGPMTLRILDGLVTFLKESNLYRGFSWTEESTGINRHASLHGKDCSYNTRANSVRMILLFDALYWVLLALQNSRSQKSLLLNP